MLDYSQRMSSTTSRWSYPRRFREGIHQGRSGRLPRFPRPLPGREVHGPHQGCWKIPTRRKVLCKYLLKDSLPILQQLTLFFFQVVQDGDIIHFQFSMLLKVAPNTNSLLTPCLRRFKQEIDTPLFEAGGYGSSDSDHFQQLGPIQLRICSS